VLDVLSSKPARRGFASAQAVYCHQVAHCPGCLGHRVAGVQIVLCPVHVMVDVDTLPVVSASAAAVSSPESDPLPEQSSLW
jgi:hypothetical protein